MRKNLLKRYNDFIKVNENQETEAPVKPEIKQEPAPTETPPDKRREILKKEKREERYTVPTPLVNPDPLAKDGEGVEDNLEYLHDTLEGSELMSNILNYGVHKISQPSEFEGSGYIFDIDGVKLRSSEEVIDYLKNPEAQTKAKAKQDRRLQAQAQRAQAQVETAKLEEVDYDQLINQIEGGYHGSKSDIRTNKSDEKEFETPISSGVYLIDPEEEAYLGKPTLRQALYGEKVDGEEVDGDEVDVEETGKLHKESKSYRNRFRTKL